MSAPTKAAAVAAALPDRKASGFEPPAGTGTRAASP